MASFLTLIALLILKFCLAASAEQQIKFAVEPNPVQCAAENLQWTGGLPPFVVTIGTTSDANASSALAAPDIQTRNYTWNPVDIPGGTPITITVQSKAGDLVETPTINIQNSSDSSCLSGIDSSPPPSGTATGITDPTNLGPTTTRTLTPGTNSHSSPGATNPPGSPGATGSPPSSTSSSHVAIIAGVVVGVIVLLALIIVLMMMQKRRERRNHMSSKQALVQTFGNAKADLDSAVGDDEEAMAAQPEPYVYGSVSRTQPGLAIETEDLSRRPSSTRTGPAPTSASSRSPLAPRRSPQSAVRSPATPATRKGERYLPNLDNSPTSPGGAPGGRSGIQEEDIDRLAARMVAMMSAGRLSEQAWTPGAQGTRGPTLDEDTLSPPPMYKDVARSGGRPREL